MLRCNLSIAFGILGASYTAILNLSLCEYVIKIASSSLSLSLSLSLSADH